MKQISHAAGVFALALAVGLISGLAEGAPQPDLSLPQAARRFAQKSTAPLAEGTGDCQFLADRYRTLGSAIRWHAKRANIENTVTCTRENDRWGCKASFVYNDRKASEREWAAFFEFAVVAATGSVVDLKCSLAG